MAAETPICDFGAPAPDFRLRAADGRTLSRDDVKGPAGLLVAFVCNHCPYVKAIAPRLARDAEAIARLGVGVVAINPNPADLVPDDAFELMAPFAQRYGWSFPYLHDADQSVARAYGAVCTPDFFGYDAGLGLQYRGRLDASRAQPGPADAPRELLEAMRAIAQGRGGPAAQTPSMGCSIKWRAA